MPETVAIDLSLATNEVGAPAFPGITPNGGTLAGLPVFTSQYVPTDTDGPVVALIKGDEIFLGDEGGIQVSVSDQASLRWTTPPTMNSTTPTGSSDGQHVADQLGRVPGRAFRQLAEASRFGGCVGERQLGCLRVLSTWRGGLPALRPLLFRRGDKCEFSIERTVCSARCGTAWARRWYPETSRLACTDAAAGGEGRAGDGGG